MDIKSLDKSLEDSVQLYIEESKLIASDQYGKNPVTEGDLFAMSRLTVYLMDEFREKIVSYLKSK